MYLSPDYSPDILISYSHGDVDLTGRSELNAWSQAFARAFEFELRLDAHLRDVAVFLDESQRVENRVDPTLPLTEQLRTTVRGAGLLTILMSPQYLKSPWCRDEREWWLAHHGKRGDVRGRIFVVRILPTAEESWPETLRDERGHVTVGFWFHRRDDDGSAVRPFGWRGRSDDQSEFTEQLLKLVGAVSRRLRALKGQLEATRRAQEEAERLAAASGQTLYLHAREEHREAWSRAYDALGQHGYVVVPAAPEPRAGTPARLWEIGEERVNQLLACDALLLLGTEDGYTLDGDMLTVGRQSRHLARARSGKLLPCAVLATASNSINTAQRLSLARKLAIGWIDASGGGLQGVHDWLVQAIARVETAV